MSYPKTPKLYNIHSNRKSLLWWWQRIFWANPRDTKVSRLMSWMPWPRSWALSMTSTKLEMGSTAQHSLMDPGMAWLENSLARLVCFLFISVNQCPDFSPNISFWESGHIVLFWNGSPIIRLSKVEKIRKIFYGPTASIYKSVFSSGWHCRLIELGLISVFWRDTDKVWELYKGCYGS